MCDNTIKTVIKHVSLVLLLCIFTTQSMEHTATIPVSSEPFTMHNLAIADDILKEIFKHLYSSQAKVDDPDEVIVVAEMTKKLRSVCKYWYHAINPVGIRQLLNWHPREIAGQVNHHSASSNERYCRWLAFLTSTIRDEHDLIDLHEMIREHRLLSIKIALANSADPNRSRWGITPLFYASRALNIDIFELLLRHGADMFGRFHNRKTHLIKTYR